MASAVFDVTPEDLEASASKIEDKAQEFSAAQTSIYTAVSDLHVSFQGEASETFTRRLEDYKSDFGATEKTLENYIQFLRNYASKLKQVESNIKSMASSLSTGD